MMKPVGAWIKKPGIVGRNRLHKPFFVSINSVFVDEEKKTVWLKLDETNFSMEKKGAFNIGFVRRDVGTAQDFKFLPMTFTNNPMTKGNAIELLSDMSFWDYFTEMTGGRENLSSKNIFDKINHVLGVLEQINTAKEQGQNARLPEDISKRLVLTSEDIKVFENLNGLINKLPKKPINDLLSNENFSLLIGNLNLDQLMDNVVATEEDNVAKDISKRITVEEATKYFEDIILDFKIKEKFYTGMGLPQIFEGKKPKTGGVILIDHGGTGKSLLKSRMIKFFKKIGGETKEKTQGSITSYVNAGPQVIQKWYRGGSASEVTGGAEIDLVEAAKKSGVPSLMVIDEAEEFIRERKDSQKDSLNALNTLKRYIQDANKGGVTGYVLTLLIANIDSEDIHAPLQQGAERLTVVYVGPPNSVYLWQEVISFIFKDNNLEFKNNNINIELLAEIMFDYQNKVSHEKYAITPRRFGAYCSQYYSIHSEDDIHISSDRIFFLKLIHGGNRQDGIKEKKWKIDYYDFCINFVNEMLTEELNNDPLVSNKKELINTYISWINSRLTKMDVDNSKKHEEGQEKYTEQLEESIRKSYEKNLIESLDESMRFLIDKKKNLVKIANENLTDDNSKELIKQYLANFYNISENIENYAKYKDLKIYLKGYKQYLLTGRNILGTWFGEGFSDNQQWITKENLLYVVEVVNSLKKNIFNE